MTTPSAVGGQSLSSWLAALPEADLIALLLRRPDLAQPAPISTPALAARAASRQSIMAAAEELDFLHLAVLDALLVLGADRAAVPADAVGAQLGDRASEADVRQAVADLRACALIWGQKQLQVCAEAAVALPWHPGQAVFEQTRPAEELTALLDSLDDDALDVLERLAIGSPLGRTRDAAPGTPADRPVQRLLAVGLLRRIDDDTVLLTRDAGQVLRGETTGPSELTAPDPVVANVDPSDVDASAAGAAMELIRQVDAVIETLSAAPIPQLRSGGLGVREAKRLAKSIGVDDQRTGLILELAVAAGLVTSGVPDPPPADDAATHWAPTAAADRFLAASAAARWLTLAGAWLDLPSRPGLIGSRGPDAKPYAALSDSLYSSAAPVDRRLLLALLDELPAGSAVAADSASRALIWRRPRWGARLQTEPVRHLLTEAHAVGLTGRDALAGPGRALLTTGEDAALAAMAAALPAPIDHFLVQADLTVVVPGPLERDLADELAAVATLESAGAAMVFRVSEQSVRHALDIGQTAEGLQRFFEEHSRTPVPQGLSYLIADVARRHGQLRVGVASSFLRCDDPVLLSQAVGAPGVAGLQLRLLAPTVAVSQAPIADLLTTLRQAGFVPAAEDSSGAVVDLRRRGARLPANPLRRPSRTPTRPTPASVAAMVAVLRRVDAAPTSSARLDPAVAMGLLQHAATRGANVLMGYVDAAGVATQRVVSPIAVHGGYLMAFDPAQNRMREFAVHRVTAVTPTDAG